MNIMNIILDSTNLNIPFSILWVTIALVTGLLMSKVMKLIHFPNVTGFLISGILIGPFVLGLINQDLFSNTINNLSWISDIALGFIAFTIGGSFKVSAIKKVGKKATIISIFEALGGSIIVIVGLFIAYFCGMDKCGLKPSIILTLGAIACATAPAATLLVINQYKAKGPVTETLIPVVAFDDAVALIAFSILFSVAKILEIGGSFNAINAILIPILEIVLSLVIGAILGFIISFMTKFFTSRHNRLIICIASVLLVVAISSVDTISLGWGFNFQLSSLLTIMAMSAVYVNFAKGVDTTNEYLDKFTSPIFMLFFVISGSKLDFSVFGKLNILGLVLSTAGIYIITRIIGKWLGSYLGCVTTKCDPIVKKYLGFTLIPQAGVALGLAAQASNSFNVPLFEGETSITIGSLIYTIIIVSTMIYELSGPLVTKWALVKAGEISKENK